MEILFLKAFINFLKAKTEIALLFQGSVYIIIFIWFIILLLGTLIPWAIWCIAHKIVAIFWHAGSGIKRKIIG